MKQVAVMMSLILIGVIILSSAERADKNESQQIQEEHDEGYYDLIGQEALKHL